MSETTAPPERTEWDTPQLREDFEVVAFAAPFVLVVRRATGQRGVLTFEHYPRRYFDWTPE